jgi:hypothetical protein
MIKLNARMISGLENLIKLNKSKLSSWFNLFGLFPIDTIIKDFEMKMGGN